ncbi:MAG TPA: hypothetical protein GX739_05365 [Firmicutes bacterium]|nr:hypothetical protein [Bacillota bacterium]
MFRTAKVAVTIVCVLMAVSLLSGAAHAQSRLLVGYTGAEWFAGVETESTARRLLGFIGYQEDVVSGLLAVTNRTPKLLGYVQAGREVFMGNVKYSIRAHGGNPDFHRDLMADPRLGVRGEFKQLSGKLAYGIEGEVNLLGKPLLRLMPYVEFRSNGVLKTQLEFGTGLMAFGLAYELPSSSQTQSQLFATYDFKHSILDYGASLTLADSLTLTGTMNTDYEIGLGLIWKGADYPVEVNIKWQENQVQWYVSYAFKI